MTHLIEVAFGGNRKGFYQWEGETPPLLRTAVIVEADRGEDLGHVHATGALAETRCRGCSHGCGTAPPPTERALRIATDEDIASAALLAEENQTARKTAHERAREAQLVMKISDAEWQWDRRKLTLYFTAEKRIDFRGLVRELAGVFRTRIELKQIGVRDEAKRLSGIGRCGREYCSASWLPDLRPVNLGVAKDQRLSLNPTQISGACGRLMCCLRYEHEFYVQSRRRFPKEGKILRTITGEVKVIAFDIFRDTVTLRTPEGDTRIVALAQLRDEMESSGERLAASDSDLAAERSTDRTAERTVYAEEHIVQHADESQELHIEGTGEPMPREPMPVESMPVESMSRSPMPVEPKRDESAVAGEASTETDDEAARRKRRRGRRGGRRLRGERSGDRGSERSTERSGERADTPETDGPDDNTGPTLPSDS